MDFSVVKKNRLQMWEKMCFLCWDKCVESCENRWKNEVVLTLWMFLVTDPTTKKADEK